MIQGRRATEALSDGQFQLCVAVEQTAIPVADGDQCGGIPPDDGPASPPLARPDRIAEKPHMQKLLEFRKWHYAADAVFSLASASGH